MVGAIFSAIESRATGPNHASPPAATADVIRKPRRRQQRRWRHHPGRIQCHLQPRNADANRVQGPVVKATKQYGAWPGIVANGDA